MNLEAGQNVFVSAAKKNTLTPDPDCGQGQAQLATGGCPIVGDIAGIAQEKDCPIISKDFEASSIMPSISGENISKEKPLSDTGSREDALGEHNKMSSNEQIFFNAMRRKGWNPTKDDLHKIVSLHSAVNERTWTEILRWEQMHCNVCKEPKLQKFISKPNDLSPKAFISSLLGYGKPFDRYDWVVSRCGTDIRYVVEFYNAAPSQNMPFALKMDVRPALSPQAFWDRLKTQFPTTANKNQNKLSQKVVH